MNAPKIVAATYAGDYRIRVEFEDGKSGILNMEDELWGAVFEPLKDLELFKQFEIDEQLSTIVWPTGVDLAPEYLYQVAA